jgi:hypothetical protein
MLIQLPVANIKLSLLNIRPFSRQPFSHIIIHLFKKRLTGNPGSLVFLPVSSFPVMATSRIESRLTDVINFKTI